MDTQGFIERLQMLIDKEGFNPSSFANHINVQRSTLSHLLHGRNKPSVELLLKIHSKFPNYSIDYLLLGKMGVTTATEKETSTHTDLFTSINKNKENTPVTPVNNTDMIKGNRELVVLNTDGTYTRFKEA